jgi:chromosome segregation ATPase
VKQEQKLKSQKEHFHGYKDEVRNYKAQIAELTSRNEKLKQTVADLDANNADLFKQNGDLQDRAKRLDKVIERHKTDIHELQEAQSRDIAPMTAKLARMRVHLDGLKEVEALRTKEIKRLNEHVNAQQQEKIVSRQGEAAQLRSELLSVNAELTAV